MAKEQLTKKQLAEKKVQLEQEIKTLEDIINASNSPLFDMLVAEIKKDMEDNIAEEDWKSLKQNQKKIESYRDVEKIIQNQTDLLERKQEELEEIEYSLNNYQQNLFENSDEPVQQELKSTGIVYENQELFVGDVFRCNYLNNKGEKSLYLVKQSSEKDGCFAIMSTNYDGEKLLQYPKNQEELKSCSYVGNIFILDDDQQAALDALAKIYESQRDQVVIPQTITEGQSSNEKDKS